MKDGFYSISFEDGILIALEIVDRTESKEEIHKKLEYLLDSYETRKFFERLTMIKNELALDNSIP